jgi:hypothetical protein
MITTAFGHEIRAERSDGTVMAGLALEHAT